MQNGGTIVCDGCGQAADGAHIAQRLKRLERVTRYRPIHVQTLFLGSTSPAEDRDHLYSTEGEFHGEGMAILRALGIEHGRRSVGEVLSEIQRQGLLITHVLECPLSDAQARQEAMQKRLPSVLARIRRSYKPKRVVLVGTELCEFVTSITNGKLEAVVVLHSGRPFEWARIRPDLLAKEATAAPEAL
jgi:hypothetical protein